MDRKRKTMIPSMFDKCLGVSGIQTYRLTCSGCGETLSVEADSAESAFALARDTHGWSAVEYQLFCGTCGSCGPHQNPTECPYEQFKKYTTGNQGWRDISPDKGYPAFECKIYRKGASEPLGPTVLELHIINGDNVYLDLNGTHLHLDKILHHTSYGLIVSSILTASKLLGLNYD